MTALVEMNADARSHHERSARGAFWLLFRLRLTRWRNRRRAVLWGRAAASPGAVASRAGGRRGAHARPRSLLGTLLGPALLVAFLTHNSNRTFAGLVREHGAAALQGRAVLFSCLVVTSLLFVTLLGSRAWDAQGNDDADWLSTLPAPAWVLHTARIAEAALWNPAGWLLIFPFFTGLALHVGLGLLAPLVALALSLPLYFACAVLGSVIDVVSHAWSRSRVFRVLRNVLPVIAALLMIGWLGASVLQSLSLSKGPLKVDVDPFGGWLDFTADLAWLPFSEPARALLTLRQAPLTGLAWLVSFGVQMTVLVGAGLLVLRKFYRAERVAGRIVRHGARGAGASARPVARHSSGARRFGPVIAKDLLWLWRNPQRSMGLVLNVILFNGLGLLFLPRLSGLDARLPPGVLLLGVGTMLVIAAGALLLELEQPALWQWASLPRSLASVLAHKTLLVVVLATAGASPVALHALRASPSVRDAAPGVLYGAACITVLAVLHTSLWLRHVSPSAAASPLHHLGRAAQVLLVAGILGIGFLPSVTTASLVPFVVLVAAFVVAHGQKSVARFPFVLDPSARLSPALTTTFALIALVATRTLQVQLNSGFLRIGSSPSKAATMSILAAGIIGLTVSFVWLTLRGVGGLRERLGLGAGKGLRVILREGVLWALPAIVVNLGYWALIAPRLAPSSAPAPAPETVMTQLASSSLAVFAVGAFAVPLIEELLYRGMLYRSLRSGFGLVLSVLVSSVVFVVDHTLIAALPILVASVCITLAFERSRSLYAAMLVHALYNGFIGVLMALH